MHIGIVGHLDLDESAPLFYQLTHVWMWVLFAQMVVIKLNLLEKMLEKESKDFCKKLLKFDSMKIYN